MLTAFYDLAVSPPTFDALGFLVSAERRRLELGLETMRIVIVPGPDNGFRKDNLPPRDPKVRMRMLKKIVLKLCKLMPCVVEVEHLPTRAAVAPYKTGHVFPLHYDETRPAAAYGSKQIYDSVKAGCMPFRADVPTTRNERLISITMREANYWPSRNSNVAEWQKVARHFMRQGYEIVFVRDTELATRAMPGFDICPDASISLQARLALYETARLNLFVNSGPSALGLLSGKVAMMLCKLEAPDAPCTSAAFFAAHGLPKGSQLLKPDSQILWNEDRADLIIPVAESLLGIDEAQMGLAQSA